MDPHDSLDLQLIKPPSKYLEEIEKSALTAVFLWLRWRIIGIKYRIKNYWS